MNVKPFFAFESTGLISADITFSRNLARAKDFNEYLMYVEIGFTNIVIDLQ